MGNIADRRTSSGEITTLVRTVLLVLGLFVLHVRGAGGLARHGGGAPQPAGPADRLRGVHDRRLGGAIGASWGVTIAQVFSALLWGHQLRSALTAHHKDPAVAG
jgi:hypothetical protein